MFGGRFSAWLSPTDAWAVFLSLFDWLLIVWMLAECRKYFPKNTTSYQGRGFCQQTMDYCRTTPKTCVPRRRWELTSSNQPMGRRVMGKPEWLAVCLLVGFGLCRLLCCPRWHVKNVSLWNHQCWAGRQAGWLSGMAKTLTLRFS